MASLILALYNYGETEKVSKLKRHSKGVFDLNFMDFILRCYDVYTDESLAEGTFQHLNI